MKPEKQFDHREYAAHIVLDTDGTIALITFDRKAADALARKINREANRREKALRKETP